MAYDTCIDCIEYVHCGEYTSCADCPFNDNRKTYDVCPIRAAIIRTERPPKTPKAAPPRECITSLLFSAGKEIVYYSYLERWQTLS